MRRIGCSHGQFAMTEKRAVIILFTEFKPAAYGGGSVTCGQPSTVLGAAGVESMWFESIESGT